MNKKNYTVVKTKKNELIFPAIENGKFQKTLNKIYYTERFELQQQKCQGFFLTSISK